MLLKKEQYPILVINVLQLIFFTIWFITHRNVEFILYIGVIVFFFLVVLFTNRKVQYSNTVLWGLTLWAFMHFAGGGFIVNGHRWYEIILIPLSATYEIFKYDQLVHMIGFGVVTLMFYDMLQKKLGEFTPSLWLIVLMAGLGMGALNEIVEFIVTVIAPSSGVGVYTNTALDLVADLIGGLIACGIILLKKSKHF